MKTKWQLIFRFLNSNKFIVTIAFISGLLYNIFTLLVPISIGKFYEYNFGFSSHRLKLLESFPFINTESFKSFLWLFMILILLRFVFDLINKYFIGLIGEKFSKDLREILFKHQLQVKPVVYDSKGIGKYLLRYSGDLKSIQNYVTRGLLRFSQDVILILILIVAIGFINYQLSVIVAVFMAFSIVILFIINNKLYTISIDRRNQRSGMLTFVNTRLRAISSIKAFNKYTPEEKRYNKRSNKLYSIGKKQQFVVGLIQSIIPLLTYAMLASLMWYIFHLKNSGDSVFNEASILVLILLIISFLPILRRTLRVSVIWKIGNISFQKLINVLSLEEENKLPFNNEELVDNDISFKNISFRYPDSDSLIFDDLNFVIPSKKTTLVIGESGTGKNTLIKLILKMYSPTKGILNFGKDEYLNLSEKTIRKNISVISDSFPLYGKTVHEAIVYSRKKGKTTKVENLLRDIQQFENEENVLNLDDKIGDLGNKLTNGQKRILMYCRMLLTNKPLFIIDQPFKDLNIKTKAYITDKLNSLNGKKTIIYFGNQQIEDLKVDQTLHIKSKSVKAE